MKKTDSRFLLVVILLCLSCSRKPEEKMRQDLLAHKDEIIAWLKDPKPEKRVQAIGAIQMLRLREAVPQLRDLAEKDTDEHVRASAIGALATLCGQEAVPVMLKALESEDLWTRQTAAIKLARLGRKEGVAALIQLLDSEDERTQVRAFFILKSMTKKDFGTFQTLQNIPGQPRVLRDREKMREVFARWKNWWRDEGEHFSFPNQ